MWLENSLSKSEIVYAESSFLALPWPNLWSWPRARLYSACVSSIGCVTGGVVIKVVRWKGLHVRNTS